VLAAHEPVVGVGQDGASNTHERLPHVHRDRPDGRQVVEREAAKATKGALSRALGRHLEDVTGAQVARDGGVALTASNRLLVESDVLGHDVLAARETSNDRSPHDAVRLVPAQAQDPCGAQDVVSKRTSMAKASNSSVKRERGSAHGTRT
jgi:hypothetical protein